jgi:predicted nucleic acid-binding Zn ribbon protein
MEGKRGIGIRRAGAGELATSNLIEISLKVYKYRVSSLVESFTVLTKSLVQAIVETYNVVTLRCKASFKHVIKIWVVLKGRYFQRVDLRFQISWA